MKKKNLIILSLILLIVVCVIAGVIVVKMFSKNNEPEPTPNIDIVTPENDVKKFTKDEIGKLAVDFYKNVYNWDVTVTFGEEKDNVIELTAKVTPDYSESMNVDLTTAIGTLTNVNCKIDFEKGTYIRPYPEVKYDFDTKSNWVAIASVPMNNLLKFENKYFETETTYNYMRRLDVSTTSDEANKENLFIFGREPRVNVTVCKSHNDENGAWIIDEEIMSISSEPFVVIMDKFNTQSNICLKISYPTVEFLYPVEKDEVTGKLKLEGYEELVDISLY